MVFWSDKSLVWWKKNMCSFSKPRKVLKVISIVTSFCPKCKSIMMAFVLWKMFSIEFLNHEHRPASDQLSPENSLSMNCMWREPVGGAWNKMAQLLSLWKPFTVEVRESLKTFYVEIRILAFLCSLWQTPCRQNIRICCSVCHLKERV